MNNIIIEKLKAELLKPLPGLHLQAKMAPKERLNNYNPNPKFAKRGGVLLLLHYSDNELYMTFIKRAEDEGIHSGQIAFPGGKFEKTDINIIETSLREANEEIGIDKNAVEVIGTLTNLYIPVSNYNVYPTVGFCTSEPRFVINKREVERVFTVPLKEFFKHENIKFGAITVRGQNIKTPFYEIENQIIWGATAMIMSEFVEISKNIYS
ncbi:MAG: CoA pyrophosphatase [Bacteroidales bacterium]|nr:CoA pyrophosphatase [Bacteroidales bacterium]MBN2758366.1 CoA pyrophosphatase [Bacteroidales bacterium]